jgi:hypothetical protein
VDTRFFSAEASAESRELAGIISSVVSLDQQLGELDAGFSALALRGELSPGGAG